MAPDYKSVKRFCNDGEKMKEYYESQNKASLDIDTRDIDREATIKSILSLNPALRREYLSTKPLDVLHDLEDSLLNTTFETP